MAIDITISLSDDREAELNKITNESNIAIGIPSEAVTPTQWLRRYVRDFLDMSASQRTERDRLALRAAYKAAPANVQTQVDTLLAPYK